jgi:hypothetical protein
MRDLASRGFIAVSLNVESLWCGLFQDLQPQIGAEAAGQRADQLAENLALKAIADTANASSVLGALVNGQGDTSNVMVIGHSDIPVVNSIRVTSVYEGTGVFTILLCQMYDWQFDDWIYIDFGLFGGDSDPDDFGNFVNTHVVNFNGSRFVRDSDDAIYIRLWTLAIGGFGGFGGGGSAPYVGSIDWINLEVSELIGAYDDTN